MFTFRFELMQDSEVASREISSWIAHQSRSQVLTFGGTKYIFKGDDFCLYYMFKQFLGEQKICEGKSKLGGYFLRMPARGYGPVAHSSKLSLETFEILWSKKSYTTSSPKWGHLLCVDKSRQILSVSVIRQVAAGPEFFTLASRRIVQGAVT